MSITGTIQDQVQSSRAHQKITVTIQAPPINNRNHPRPTRKCQQPSRAQQEMTVTIHDQFQTPLPLILAPPRKKKPSNYSPGGRARLCVIMSELVGANGKPGFNCAQLLPSRRAKSIRECVTQGPQGSTWVPLAQVSGAMTAERRGVSREARRWRGVEWGAGVGGSL